MRIGAILPQLEIGTDPAGIRDYAQAVEEMGYSHIAVFDHVLGADPSLGRPLTGPYTSDSLFHEVFVLFGYLSAVTQQVELVTDVLVLGQRQTALVAKQAAEVDVLSNGRLRLGIGTGWNWVEYQALNENFHDRGVRSEEQIAVMRALWAEPVITYHGRWHHIEAAGLNPLPPRRSIPIWIGGGAEPVLRRVGRIGDGWFPLSGPNDRAREAIARIHGYAREAGRPPEAIGIEPQMGLAFAKEERWPGFVQAWREIGATHLGVNTMNAGLNGPQAHIDALRRVKEVVGF